jgi:hypothetical protein
MKSKKWFTGILATVFALSLASAASAQCGGGVCGRGAKAGRENCFVQAGKGSCPNYQQGQGRKKGHGRQQCRSNSTCPLSSAGSAPATQPAPSN